MPFLIAFLKKVNKKYFSEKALYLLAFIIPFADALIIVFSGRIPFWYDPARELLLAMDKFTLIGPPSGIQGLFYGPYWIWLLKVGLFLSKDPQVIAFLFFTLPYFTLFPYLLFKFSKFFGKKIMLMVWLLFVFFYIFNYSTQLWNINFTPLLIFCVITLIIFNNKTKSTKHYLYIFTTGLTIGLLANFNLSIGAGVLVGVYLFLIIDFLIKMKKKTNSPQTLFDHVANCIIVSAGIALTFIPFAIFEYRHGFNQIQVVIGLLTGSGEAIGQVGLAKDLVAQMFLGTIGKSLGIPWVNPYLLTLPAFGLAFFILKKRYLDDEGQNRLLLLLASIATSTFSIYMLSKNPIWDYHFVGIEILALLFIAWIVCNVKILEKALTLWIITLTIINIWNFAQFVGIVATRPNTLSSLGTKKQTVESVYKDAGEKPFTVFVYSSAIYTFDYDYLFKWRGATDVSHQPEEIIANSHAVYLIIPQAPDSIKKNFINYNTPDKAYKTVKTWKNPDKTIIIKREKL